MEVNIFQVDAFSSRPFGGNPACIIPNAKRINEEDMKKIANEMNVTETAFINMLGEDLFKIKYFTPVCEVDLCGHSTIAAFHTMAHMGYIKPIKEGVKEVELITNIGKLIIEIRYKDGNVEYIMMQQKTPESHGNVENLSEILSAMGLNESHIGIAGKYIEPEIVNSGISDIMLPVNKKEVLDNIIVDYCSLMDASRKAGVKGVHAFYVENQDSSICYTRNFSPRVGINEEAATGTANGSLIYYLTKNNLIKSRMITSIQGEAMKRSSKIFSFIDEEKGRYKVKVGGSACIVLEGILKY